MRKANSTSHPPDKVERTILNASLEVLGQDDILPIFKRADLSYLIEGYSDRTRKAAFDLTELGRMQATLEDVYGKRSGRGLALRTGRAIFKHVLREFRPTVEITEPKFRLLPLDEKMHAGAEFMAQVLSSQLEKEIYVQEKEGKLLWIIQDCPLCRGRNTSSPSCHIFLGFLQEAYYWISGGSWYLIEETDCIAVGDPVCTFVLYTPPIK